MNSSHTTRLLTPVSDSEEEEAGEYQELDEEQQEEIRGYVTISFECNYITPVPFIHSLSFNSH